jgi:hypothetical protein
MPLLFPSHRRTVYACLWFVAAAIFVVRLAAVAALAKRLPVLTRPKELTISAPWLDVIDLVCRYQSPEFLTM